jgi:hypothetical protein
MRAINFRTGAKRLSLLALSFVTERQSLRSCSEIDSPGATAARDPIARNGETVASLLF